METNLQIYVQRDEQQHGPYSRRVAKAMLKDGTLSPDDLAWHEGLEDWQPLADLLQQPKESSGWNREAVFGIILAAFAVLGLLGRLLKDKPERQPKPASAPTKKVAKPGIVESLVNPPDTRAKNSAKTLVLKNLKAPATARFAEVRILKKEDPWFQLLVTVDSQNGFGALIRSSFVCTLQIENGDKFSYHPSFGFQEADDSTSQAPEMLEMIRRLNNWPGSKGATTE